MRAMLVIAAGYLFASFASFAAASVGVDPSAMCSTTP